MIKMCDLGLENAALGLGQHFQDLSHNFLLYGPLSRQITYMNDLLKFKAVFCQNVAFTARKRFKLSFTSKIVY